MNAQKAIKQQARAALANGNWTNAILGFFTVALIPTLMFIISSFTEFIAAKPDDLKNTVPMLSVFVIELLAVCAFVFLSPLYLGFKKMLYNMGITGTAKASDLIYYFSGLEEYGSAIYYCVVMLTRYVEWFIVSALPAVVLGVCWFIMQFYGVGKSATIIMQTTIITLCIMGFALFYIATRRYYLTSYLFFSSNGNINPVKCVKDSVSMMKGNTLKSVALLLKNIPWFLLCFFVVPWFYVYPYYQTAKAINAHYIIDIAKPIKDNMNDANGNINNENITTSNDFTQQLPFADNAQETQNANDLPIQNELNNTVNAQNISKNNGEIFE